MNLKNQLSSSNILSMHIISVNMSALPHCQVWDEQEWSDKWDCIIVGIVTLPTCNCFFEKLSAFNSTYRCITQRCKKCMSWCLIAWYIKNYQGSHCETVKQWDSRLVTWVSVFLKNNYVFVIFFHLLAFLNKMADLCFTTVTLSPEQKNDMLHISVQYC